MNKKKAIITILSALIIIGISIPIAIHFSTDDDDRKDIVDVSSEAVAVGDDVVEGKADTSDIDSKTTEVAKPSMTEKPDTITEAVSKETKGENKTEKKEIKTEVASNNVKSNDTTENTTTEASLKSDKQTADVSKTTETANTTTEAVRPSTTEKPNSTTEAAKPSTTEKPDTTTEAVKPSTTEATTERQKIWHEPVYEQVWVVDEEAWDENIYEVHCICNTCNLDLTVAGIRPSSHLGGGEGDCESWHSENVLVNTIHHNEVGHYEQKLVTKGYWE